MMWRAKEFRGVRLTETVNISLPDFTKGLTIMDDTNSAFVFQRFSDCAQI